MAVIEVIDVRSRKFSGYEDPRYPSGFWVGNGLVTGDVTGGNMTLQVDFAKAAGLRNSQYYSLEQLTITQNPSAGVVVEMLVSNFDEAGLDVTTLTLESTEGSFAGLAPVAAGLIRRFLGQQVTPNSAMGISFTRDNDDGQTMTVRSQGYLWSARSTSVPGGPQRPPTGLYPL